MLDPLTLLAAAALPGCRGFARRRFCPALLPSGPRARPALRHHSLFECLSRQEFEDAFRRHFHLLARRRVASHARRTIAHFELAEAGNLYSVARDTRRFDV